MMHIFSDPHISLAHDSDVSMLVQLLNSAYRGESSKKGWTSEAHLISGDTRSNETSVKEVMKKSGSVILVYNDDENRLVGCVNLQQHGHRIYLGMFSVSPLLQGGGIGKKLLHAAEEYARSADCRYIYMTVITLREELVNWYKRHGYVDTGERRPFEEDGITGRHLQKLEFMVLEKYLQ